MGAEEDTRQAQAICSPWNIQGSDTSLVMGRDGPQRGGLRRKKHLVSLGEPGAGTLKTDRVLPSGGREKSTGGPWSS